MRDERLLRREFQPELFPKERSQTGFDFLSFLTCPHESKQKVVRVPDVFQATVIWIIQELGGKLLSLLKSLFPNICFVISADFFLVLGCSSLSGYSIGAGRRSSLRG